MQKYYFITVMEKLEENPYYYVDTGCTRCWGFYTSKNTALTALHENWTDMWETIYTYAVLEEYYEGIGASTMHRQFFKYDKDEDGYFEIDEPECVKHTYDFAIG